MIYLLDTDTLIFMIRGLKASGRQWARRQRAMKLTDRCRQAQRDGNTVALSAITVCELEFGARHSGRYNAEIAAVRKVLLPFDTFDYDAVNCAAHYGRIRYDLEQAGQTIGAMDLLIAAHALSLSATLVTNNQAHFGRVPNLMTANWSS
jgi:tRNA(fMet)-specific endonuclease VapC